MGRQVKAIIIDVDGVIVKMCDEQGNYLWSQTIEKDLGLSEHHIAQIFSARWKQEVLPGKLETMRYLEAIFNEPAFKALDISPEVFLQYWITQDRNPNHDMLYLIDALSIPVYMGTNQEAHRTKYLISLFGDRFKGCFASYQIGATKPEPLFYRYIERVLDLKPQDLLLVDDTPVHVEAAKKCGWHGYHYQEDVANLRIFINKQS